MSPWPVLGAVAGVLCLAVAAQRRWLTPSGVVAALVTGAALIAGTHAAGPLLLVLFLSSSSLLGGIGSRPEAGPASGAADAPRTAGQVLANVAVPAVAALLAATGNFAGSGSAIAGGIAAMTADTWATEVGAGLRAPARLITSLERVEPGESGGISLPGTLAGLSGAVAIALLAAALPRTAWGPTSGAELMPVAAGGVCGLLTDSLLGATLERRWSRLDNESVNFLASLTGAAAAFALAI